MDMENETSYMMLDIPIFKEFDREDIRILSQYLFPKDLEIDGLVCKEGQQGNFLSFVASGKLDVIKIIDDEDVRIATLQVGDTLGEMAIIDGLTRSATVRASQASTILMLRRDDFNKLLENHPNIGIKLLKSIARLLSLNLRRAY